MTGSEVLVTALQVGAVLAVVGVPRVVFARAQHRRLWFLISSADNESR